MKKRIISLILVLALCLSLLPLAAVAADGEPADDALQQPTDALRDTGSTGEGAHEDHYYCGGATCAHNDPRFENAQPIATAEELLAAGSGNYYLTADTFLPSTWTPKDGTVLCLNGKVLTLKKALPVTVDGKQTTLPAGTKLTVTAMDAGNQVYFRTTGGVDGSIQLEENTNESDWCFWRIDGIKDEDYFESLPYVG